MKSISMEQVAGMNLHYQRYSFSYFLDSLERCGLSCFELWAGAPHLYNYNGEPNSARIKEIKKEAARRGLKIICLTPEQCFYAPNIASPDPELRGYSVGYFTRYIEQAAELEAPRFLTSAGWGLFDQPAEDAWKWGTESFGRLLRKAEQEGVEIAFEILLPEESNLVNNLESTVRILELFPSPYMKCTLDTVPVCREGRSLEEYFQAVGPRITHIHLNDGVPTGHLTWGDGNQPLSEHLATLARHDYSNYITLEIANDCYYADPEAALLRGLHTLGEAMASLKTATT